jgi:aspartokinase/homoserine dehydrogenase 1
MDSKPQVFKFGGVAVGSAEAIRRAVAHVRAAAPNVAVIVSAMNGVTDLLLEAGQAALRGERERCQRAVAAFESRHLDLIEELIDSRDKSERLRQLIGASAHEMTSITESIAVLKELTPRTQDALVARGERAVAAIFTAVLEEHGVAAAYVDATEIIHTERRFGALWPDLPACERAAKASIAPLLGNGVVVIVPGYIATGPDGSVVTLGRGGSDFSAAILARSTGAARLTLFKEVDGLMTADPKSVPDARVIAEMHYREAAELAYYGAKVLHPRTMIPLVDRRIPLLVRNTFRDDAGGTRIAGDVKSGAYPVKALTAIREQALIAIEGKGMTGIPGVAGQAFTTLSSAGHSVSMISQASSESSICFVVPEAEAKHAVAALERAFELERKLHLIDRIAAQHEVALIAVVGLGMRGHAGIAARTFSALSGAGVNIIAIAQGSSELNITVAVDEKDATPALRALHDEYQLHKVRPLANSGGREAALTLLGFGQIGRELARQLVAQQPHLRRDAGVDLKITGLADRSGVRIDEDGFSPAALQKFAKQKAAGGRLFDGDGGQRFDALWPLPSYRPILVDLTSDETAGLLLEAMQHGFHIVLANKKPLAGSQAQFDQLLATAKERGLSFRYEATAGAGLPVLDTIAKLRQAGDRIETIAGCFSGTLGYILSELEKGVVFSQAVQKAQELGYTEPDPRDDLSGTDVARKALILARTLGHRAELAEIRLQPLEFSDDEFRERVAKAKREKRVLRYIARIRSRSISVGLEAVPESSPAATLHGTDNQVAIYSKRYSKNPLVVTGPGAGATVTAAGVLNDVVAIATEERRRRAR